MSKTSTETKIIETVFQTLLICQIVLLFLTIFLLIVDEFLTGQAVKDLVGEQEMSSAWAIISVVLFAFLLAIILPALIASIVGLFFWKPWARWLYCATWLIVTIIMLVYSVFDFQWDFRWGLPDSIRALSDVVDGAILTLLFIPPVATRFSLHVQQTETSN